MLILILTASSVGGTMVGMLSSSSSAWRTAAFLVALLAHLVAGLAVVSGVVLCVGAGGHVAFERVSVVGAGTHHVGVPEDGVRVAMARSGADDFLCSDLSPVSATAVTQTEPQSPPPAPAEAKGGFVPPREVAQLRGSDRHCPAAPRAPPERDPHLRLQRTVILLI